MVQSRAGSECELVYVGGTDPIRSRDQNTWGPLASLVSQRLALPHGLTPLRTPRVKNVNILWIGIFSESLAHEYALVYV
jgi:hypothetical protein